MAIGAGYVRCSSASFFADVPNMRAYSRLTEANRWVNAQRIEVSGGMAL